MQHLNRFSVLLIFVLYITTIFGPAMGEGFSSDDGFSSAEGSVVLPDYPLVLSQRLSEISSLNSDFEQMTDGEGRRPDTVYEGRLWIDRPHLFRVETLLPSKQTLVSDGEDFWSYDEDLEQVIISRLNKDLGEVPILLFGSDIESIEAAYTISGYSDEEQEFFLLEPNSDISLFRSLLLEFKGGTPSAIRINAATGEQTIIRLTNVVLNENVPKNLFDFSAPEDADIIDER